MGDAAAIPDGEAVLQIGVQGNRQVAGGDVGDSTDQVRVAVDQSSILPWLWRRMIVLS